MGRFFDVRKNAVGGISDIIYIPVLVNVDFEDNKAVMSEPENIAGKAKPPASAEVRYFSQGDRESAAAVAHQVAVELGGGTAVPIRFVGRDMTKKQPLEVWLPSGR